MVIPPLCAAYVRTEGGGRRTLQVSLLSNAADLSQPIRGSYWEIRRERPARRSFETLILLPPIESDKRFLELFSPPRLLDACGMASVTWITLSIKPSQGVIDVQDERM